MTRDDIIRIAKEQALRTVDYDLTGKPITDADVMLMGAFGPLVLRVAEAVAAAEREACAKVCETEWATDEERKAGEEFAAGIRARCKQ